MSKKITIIFNIIIINTIIGVLIMHKYIPVVNEIEGREWCEDNGYEYLGTRIHKDYGFVMEYDDGMPNISQMSKEEEEYYIKQYEKEQRKKAEQNEQWVIASDDGINSRMYRSKSKSRKDCYTFYLSEAKICSKAEAQKTAALMTQRSRVGRVWFGLCIK